MNHDNKLMHHGIKGMKWGVRKKTLPTSDIRSRYDSAKAAKKSAHKAYKKSFLEADSLSIAAFSPSKKQRQRNEERWAKATDDARKLNAASQNYKKVKRERKQQIKSTYKSINKNTPLGEKLLYNSATRKKAAKYVVDNNMLVADATKKAKGDALRNTAAYCAAYGAVTLAALAVVDQRR